MLGRCVLLFLCMFVAGAWRLRDCFKVGIGSALLLGHSNQDLVCNTRNNPGFYQDIVLQVPSYNYYKGIGYSVSK